MIYALIQALVELLPEMPEANCSCHISPPCNDCVDWSHQREVVAEARAAIAAQPVAVVEAERPTQDCPFCPPGNQAACECCDGTGKLPVYWKTP